MQMGKVKKRSKRQMREVKELWREEDNKMGKKNKLRE